MRRLFRIPIFKLRAAVSGFYMLHVRATKAQSYHLCSFNNTNQFYSPKHQEAPCPLFRFHCKDRQSTGLTSAFLAENGRDNAVINIYRPFSL